MDSSDTKYTDTEIRNANDQLVADYRINHPWARMTTVTPLDHNSANGPRWRRCVVCGLQGPSWCGRYPETKTALAWRVEHNTRHAIELLDHDSNPEVK